MTPIQFLNGVVSPNVSAVGAAATIREVVNAILTLDALTGLIHAHGKAVGVAELARHARDDDYREALAQDHRCFRLVRDIAATLKHGELSDPRRKRLARLVSQPGAVRQSGGAMLGRSPLGSGPLGSVPRMMIYVADGSPHELASKVVAEAHALLSAIVADLDASTMGSIAPKEPETE